MGGGSGEANGEEGGIRSVGGEAMPGVIEGSEPQQQQGARPGDLESWVQTDGTRLQGDPQRGHRSRARKEAPHSRRSDIERGKTQGPEVQG